jgi:hypothetical protein
MAETKRTKGQIFFSYNLQNTTQKTKDRATQIPLKPGVNSCAPVG